MASHCCSNRVAGALGMEQGQHMPDLYDTAESNMGGVLADGSRDQGPA